MRKINVIGTTGSGKSTFSNQLAERLGYPCFHMDQLFWKPNWVETGDEEFFPKVESVVTGKTWVLDGNYSRTNDIKWKYADTIVWLDYSYPRTFFQLLRRTINRVVTKAELWPGTGNRESFGRAFMSKYSIFIWFFRNYKRNRKRYEEIERSLKENQVKFVRLRSPKDAKAFLENIHQATRSTTPL